MTKLLASNWITLPVGVIIYLTATVAFWKTPTLSPRARTASIAVGHGASWEFKNPEADQLVAELKEEKRSLDRRQATLNDLAARLEKEQAEVNDARQSVQLLQTNFDKSVLRVQESETANLKKLAKVYAAMTPESAAAIFADLDDVSVAKIMVFMKEADTAGILEALSKKGDAEAKRAANLSERLRLASSRGNP